jgi:hypothetical protein
VLAVGIALYVLFDTGSAYAAAQTANPLANSTDTALSDDPSAGDYGESAALDAYEATPVATAVTILSLPVQGAQYALENWIHTPIDQDLADRAIAEGRNPLCAQCHGPGGALDPNNEWNRRNSPFGQLDANYTSTIDPSVLQEWVNPQ